MFIKIKVIPGVCIGIEFLWDHNILVIDLGILRVYVGYKNNKND